MPSALRLQSSSDVSAPVSFPWHGRPMALPTASPEKWIEWLRAGRDVLVNGSRANLRQAMEWYPTLLPVLLTVKDEVLRERLLSRGRETLEQIDARLARNALFKDRRSSDAPVHLIDNSGDLAVAVHQLLELIRLNATPDQT